MVNESLVWAIFLLPLISFLLITLVIRPFLSRFALAGGYLLIAALAASFIFVAVGTAPAHPGGGAGLCRPYLD